MLCDSVLGTSGQPVSDIYKFSSLEDHLEMLQMTLECGHLAPTAPDTLGTCALQDIHLKAMSEMAL